MTKLTIIKDKLAFTRFGEMVMFPFTWKQNQDSGMVTIYDISNDAKFEEELNGFIDVADNPVNPVNLMDILATYSLSGLSSTGLTDDELRANPLEVSLMDVPLDVRNADNSIIGLLNGLNQTTDIQPLGASIAIVNVIGTFTGTLTFEVSQNASNWQLPVGLPHSGVNQNPVSSTTSPGAWIVDVAGWKYFRVRMSAYTTGGTNVLISTSNSASINRSLSSGQASQPVTLASTTVTSISAGTNLLGDFGLQVRANATGAGNATTLNCPATPVGQSIKATAGRILGIYVNNSSATLRWMKVFNTASVTMGTTSAVLDIPIPPSNNTQFIAFPAGIGASTAIVLAITGAKGLTNNTAVTLDDVSGFISWS
jgi:hypothetical protein